MVLNGLKKIKFSSFLSISTIKKMSLPVNPSSLPKSDPPSPLEPSKKHKVLILVNSDQGLGDLVFGLKAAEVLSKISEIATSIICTNVRDFCKITSLANESETPIYCQGIDAEEDLVPNAHLYIGVATCTEKGPLFTPLPLLNPKTHFIGIAEYDRYSCFSSKQRSETEIEYKAGLSPGGLGIFFDEDLCAFRVNPEAKTEDARKIYLKSLPGPLLSDLIKEIPLERFFDHTSLYLGYSFLLSSSINFIKLCCYREKDSDKPQLDVFLPGFRSNHLSTSPLFYFLKHHIKDFDLPFLKKCNISAISSGDLSIKISEDPGKTLVLHNPIQINNGSFKLLLKASEPFFLATGDQSFSEGISAGKFIYYELLNHKRTLHDAFLKEAASQDKLRALLKILWTDFSKTVTESYAEKITEELACLQIQEENLRLCDKLHQTKNISDHLTELVKATLNLKA